MIAMTSLHAVPATTSHSTCPTLLSQPTITSRPFLLYPSVSYRFSASTTFRYASKSNLLSLGSLITIRSPLALLCKQFNIEETIFSKAYPSQDMLQSRSSTWEDNECRDKRTSSAFRLCTRWQFRFRVFRLRLLNQLLLVLVFSIDRS